MNIIKWRIWYSDKRVFDGTSFDDWTALPSIGVLVLIVITNYGRVIYDGADWYWFNGTDFGYVASGEWGIWQPKPDLICSSCIKQGIGASDEEYQSAIKEALDWH